MKTSELFSKKTGKTGLYNIQSIDNIPSIMARGLLSNEKASSIEHISIAMQEVQERRDVVYVPNGMPLHKYANLYFDSKNPMLYKKKEENENLCILKFSIKVLDIDGAIVSDSNASSQYASFYSPEDGLERIDFDLVYAKDWTDENRFVYFHKKSVKCAEVLIPYKVPFDYVIGAAVYDKSAEQKLLNMGFDRKIYVDHDCFF
ncbi:DUF4433 domain-containing protein [Butyrivibrio sp.]|jgi:hypothetical protein|uniref:DUF4433 domain-containing protein n=1 Tax=Butyrivibrio sp. TaxID=28121 RepID=UPI001EC57130|nr:DUF4433 domain-containing protein [Butyrivibrio sp.]MBE5839399.1 DUF4433 domain-containing protein [Butyrivibrio sp.]MBE5841349.1 DUF4433 domain-containing protein [Butyrivibrio sp.]